MRCILFLVIPLLNERNKEKKEPFRLGLTLDYVGHTKTLKIPFFKMYIEPVLMLQSVFGEVF